MLTWDDIEALEVRAASGAISHLEAAAVFEQAANDTPPAPPPPGGNRRSWLEDDDGPASRADLLVAAGSQYELADAHERARDAYVAAVEAGDTTGVDGRVHLLGSLLALRDPQADTLLVELLRARSSDPDLYLFVGEQLETRRHDLAAATRWYTAGVTRCSEPGAESLTGTSLLLLLARRRVRAAQGFPPDDWDEAADEIRSSSGGTLEDAGQE